MLKALAMTLILAAPIVLSGCDDDMSDVPVSTRPTAESMGVDPGTANMSMCSDGALREDCSFAPLGY